MRLKLAGRSDIARISQVLQTLHDRLPKDTTWHGVNIYLTLKDEDGNEIELLGQDGQPIEGLVFSDPNKVKRQLKKPGLSVVKST